MVKLPADAPMENPPPLAGLNPADLLAQGAADDTIGSPYAFQPPTLEEMAVIFPQFEILELIGKGGMGAVYKVRQRELDRVVALKILPPAIGESPAFSSRFTREAKALAKLNHPGIVTLYEFGQADGLYFILMEFVDGVNLGQLMRTGRISPREALAIVPQICDSLQFAHDQGIVHRDIKPENILLDRHGRVKVADFGIAKVVASVCDEAIRSGESPVPTDQTLAGNLMGTPQYMAPEQIDHPADVDHRADIYALGVVFYQMLTGELPGKDLQAPSRKVQIDVRLDEIVLRAMEKNPEQRYQQASVMKTRVEEFQSPELASRASSAPPPLKRGPFARWWWVFLIMLPLGALIGLAAGSAWAYFAPKKYEVEATIEIRAPEGTTMTPANFGMHYETIISRNILAGVAQQLDLPEKWMLDEQSVISSLKRMILVQNVRGTDLISIRLRHSDKQQAVAISNAILENYQRVSSGDVVVHEKASEPRAPVSPNVGLVIIAGSLIGFLISPLLAVVLIMILWRLFPEPRPLGSTHGLSRKVSLVVITGLFIASIIIYSMARDRAPLSPISQEAEKSSGTVEPTSQATLDQLESKATKNEKAVNPGVSQSSALLAEEPKLQFLAWQDEWKTHRPDAARHPDGSPVTDATEVEWLKVVSSGGVGVSGLKLDHEPRFLHFWFSHPAFKRNDFNEVTLLDEQGLPIKLGGNASFAASNHPASADVGNVGWICWTLSPSETATNPPRVTVRLRYTVGPMDRVSDVTPDYNGMMSLEGGSQLNGIGQNTEGRAFVAIAVDASKTQPRAFDVIAITKDGREIPRTGLTRAGNVGAGVSVENFDFEIPLDEVANFRIGTRRIRTTEWKNVILPQ